MQKMNKKHIYAMIAGFMAIVMVCLGVLWDAEDVSARDTLEGIRLVVEDNTDVNPYRVLQIVPDVATATISDDSLISGNTIQQSMGTIGYYIGGSEPIQLEKDLLQFEGSAARKNYVNLLYDINTGSGVLAPITEVSGNSAARPLSFSEYTEIYESQLTADVIAARLLDRSLHELNYASVSANHIEQITGKTMTRIAAGSGVSGNFVKLYLPADTADDAAAFFDGESGSFEKKDDHSGDFDPGFRMKNASDTTFYNAIFGKIAGRMGYIVSHTEDVTIGSDLSDAAAQANYVGKAVYRMNDNAYEYVGKVQVSENKLGIQDESGNWVAGTSSGLLGLRRAMRQSVSANDESVSANGESVSTNRGSVSSDELNEDQNVDNTTPTVSADSVPEGEEAGVSAITETVELENRLAIGTVTGNSAVVSANASENQVTATSYFILSFSYTEEAEEGVQVYGIKDYENVANGIYAIDETRPLVPNLTGTGTIAVVNSFETGNPTRFVYRFLRGVGNYDMMDDPAGTAISRVIGMRVFYQGGFTNNEWFRKSVFDRDAGEQCDSFYMEVSVKPSHEVTVDDINNTDFVYISNPDTSLIPTLGTREPMHVYGESVAGTPSTLYDVDLSNTGMRLLKRIVEDKLPVITDQAILSSGNATVSGSNVYRLCNALRLEDLESFYAACASSATETELKDAFDHINDTQTISDNHYVRENRYSYALSLSETISGGATDVLPLLNLYFDSEFSEDTVTKRFMEVLEDIRNENLYRETDGNKEPLSEKISQSAAIRYIINYAQKRVQVEKASIRVLELQPCNAYDLSVTNIEYMDGSVKKTEGTLYYRRNQVGDKTIVKQNDTKIELTQMTTAEFIGKNEDVNEVYDMIYIGLNTSMMNTDSSGKTDYNDSDMDGMIYTNVGDYVYGQPSLAGMLDSDYIDNNRSNYLKGRTYYRKNRSLGRYRYAGNDITEEKRKAIEDFIEAGYPVVIADDMVQVSTAGVKTANDTVLDNSSHMYELIQNTKGKKNLIRLSNLTESLFNWYLNLEKPQITIIGMAADSENITIPLTKAADGFYWLTYQFTLTNKSAADMNATCDCKLYVDINADGKFSKTNERVSDIVVTDSSGETQNPDEGGKYSLVMNKEYYVKRPISDEYVGVIPWKLQVTQRGNSSRRAGATGYYEINQTEPEEISILQIMSSATNNLNLQESMNNPTSMFRHYITEVDDFDITFKAITSTEYKAEHDNYYMDENGVVNYTGGCDYLDQYDMVILGFGDCYQEADNSTGAMTAIRDYIDEGRSVLCTHDTTSMVNAARGQFYAKDTDQNAPYDLSSAYNGRYQRITHWGYSFNSMIRDCVGMDRYGVKGNTDEKEKAYVPGSNRERVCSEIQGYTYWNLNFLQDTRDTLYQNSTVYKNLKGIPSNRGQYDGGTTISRVNTGQITTYPYTLDPVFPVEKTHAQYYQLDLKTDKDNDGESDIVVWYTIDDEGINRSNDIYQYSPGDVRNNYYIYNKGNVTYSGVGHSGIDDKPYSSEVDANEVKLFINTMIAAYRSGIRAPKISILENKEYTSRRIDNIYLSYDQLLEQSRKEANPLIAPFMDGVLENTENVYFTADNVSFVEGAQTLSARYFYESSDADAVPITVNGQAVPVMVKELTTDTNCQLYLASDETLATQITTADGHTAYAIDGSKVYRFSMPTAILRPGQSSVNVYVQVTATLRNTNSGKVQSMTGTKALKVVRTQLFDLD